MNKVVLSLLLVFIIFNANAQAFFQLNQAPLMLNPSMVGSTGGGRFALVSNVSKTNYSKNDYYLNQNNYVSYDALIKKYGLGVGAAFYNFNGNINTPFSYNTYGAKFSVAPKFNLLRSDKTKRGSLSPSISVGISSSNVRSFVYRDLENIILFPNNSIISESAQFNRIIETAFGLLYNSKTVLLGFSLSKKFFVNNSDVVISTGGVVPGYPNPFEKVTSGEEIKIKRQIWVGNIHISKILNLSDDLSITPYLNFSISEPSHFYYRNIGSHLVYRRFILGIGSEGVIYQRVIYIGYKTDKFKLTAGYGNNNFGEISLNVNFKKKSRNLW